ncbi:DUF523 domain-containing protein [bacterium]|nr:DUF523 domain-containing protein [bacterium]
MQRTRNRFPPRAPLVGVSACLLGDAVRYDGGHRREPGVAEALAREVRFVRICPEVGIGLGTPRETIHLVRRREDVRLRTTATEIDLTDRMAAWADRKVEELEAAGVCGFVLKARSPSCGLEVPEHTEEGEEVPGAPGMGAFARVLRERLPDLPVVEEHELRDEEARSAFVARVNAYRDRRDASGPA